MTTEKKISKLSVYGETGQIWRDYCGGKNDIDFLDKLVRAVATSGLSKEEVMSQISTMTNCASGYQNRKKETFDKMQQSINEYIELQGKNPTISQLSRKYSFNYNSVREYYEKNPDCGIIQASRGRKKKEV